MDLQFLGIDLGTTNCAAAIALLEHQTASPGFHLLQFSQRDPAGRETKSKLLPSFLVLEPGSSQWKCGLHAKSRALEMPGRVISSSKSWFVHSGINRSAAFLPWGSDEIAPHHRISPIQAAAILLEEIARQTRHWLPHLNDLADKIAVTVPASFDPAAQELTLQAAINAGLPPQTLLLEEPVAAFHLWLEHHKDTPPPKLHRLERIIILVVDIGGGTTDFALLEWCPGATSHPLKRLATSDHILLGGDNLDLTLAKKIEEQLSPHNPLPQRTFAALIAQARAIKESSLEYNAPANRLFPIAVAGSGASLLENTLRAQISDAEVFSCLLDGFFPLVSPREFPLPHPAGLREPGLPYARDPAITRHLAAFLRDRPWPHAVFFTGGTTKSPAVQQRLLHQLALWRPESPPLPLENPEPDFAVALGAASFLARRHSKTRLTIHLGASKSCYIKAGQNHAVCVLPQNTPAEQPIIAKTQGLQARIGQPVSFLLLQNSRRTADNPGDIVPLDDENFLPVAPLEALLQPPPGSRARPGATVPVSLRTTLKASGSLRMEILCGDPSLKISQPWQLHFQFQNQHPQHPNPAAPSPPHPKATNPEKTPRKAPESAGSPSAQPNAPTDASLRQNAAAALLKAWQKALQNPRQRATANQILSAVETSIRLPRSQWPASLLRHLADSWSELAPQKADPQRTDLKEAAFFLYGWLLRPGFGVPGDENRIAAFLGSFKAPSPTEPKPVLLQKYIAARRIAPGLSEAQALTMWHLWESNFMAPTPPPELLLLVSCLRTLPLDLRGKIAHRLTTLTSQNPKLKASWQALGSALSRFAWPGGAESALPPEIVEQAWESLKKLHPPSDCQNDAAHAWLRAARLTGIRHAEVSSPTREAINRILQSWGIPETKRRVLFEKLPVPSSDAASWLGETLPQGLLLDETSPPS